MHFITAFGFTGQSTTGGKKGIWLNINTTGTWGEFTAFRISSITNVNFAQLYQTTNDDGVLSTSNSIAYTPTANYHPATKKYVDDAIATAITDALGGSY